MHNTLGFRLFRKNTQPSSRLDASIAYSALLYMTLAESAVNRHGTFYFVPFILLSLFAEGTVCTISPGGKTTQDTNNGMVD